jgi:hypothetical protein
MMSMRRPKSKRMCLEGRGAKAAPHYHSSPFWKNGDSIGALIDAFADCHGLLSTWRSLTRGRWPS